MQKFNYENKQYLSKLNDLGESYYSKYISFIKFYSKRKDKILDVGCGTGTVLFNLQNKGFVNLYGIDVSRMFIKEAQRKKLKNLKSFSGKKFPYKNESFNVVGSFNVLEHTQNPNFFISEQIRLLKPGGKLIIACPNFLSIMLINNWHPRLRGFRQKSKNFVCVLKKVLDKNSEFEKIKPIKMKIFKYDSDAIVITNLIDLKRQLKKEKCEIIYESGFIKMDSYIVKILNLVPLIRYVSPSCFIVAQKK